MAPSMLLHHPTLSHYLRFIATTLGRDKLLRILQFLARFLSWHLLRKGYSASTLTPLAALQKQFGGARKVMRLGKNMEHLKAASVALDNKALTPVSRYLTTGRQLGYFGYLTLDNLGFLDSAGIYKVPAAKRLATEALRLWLVGIGFSVANGVYELRRLSEREQGVKKTEAEGALEAGRIAAARQALRRQLVCDLADMVLPVSSLGLVKIDEGLVSLAGLVSSAIGLQAAWKKTA
ncbi:peroxisomal biogenesis factor 11 [Geopyxis carbonaria]|nr:peroxisomal biogenesis factor 11 [Geopyxis carbonaria]